MSIRRRARGALGDALQRAGVAGVASAVSLLSAAGVLGQEVCEGDRAPDGQLGIEALECITPGGCAVNERDRRGWFHRFSVEPTISAMRASTRPRSGLREGDVIVAIEDRLISTAEGGRRLANVPAGTPVTLRIRRGGRELDLRIVPAPGCNTPRLTVREPWSAAAAGRPHSSGTPP